MPCNPNATIDGLERAVDIHFAPPRAPAPTPGLSLAAPDPAEIRVAADVLKAFRTQLAMDDYSYVREVISNYVAVKKAKGKSPKAIAHKLAILESQIELLPHRKLVRAFESVREENAYPRSVILDELVARDSAKAAKLAEARRNSSYASSQNSYPSSYVVYRDDRSSVHVPEFEEFKD
ncbi:uncharacterized protein LOC62_05G007644 [Vanrija pseudolonga]|uniref:Uncharacterized protein n=1 Tax=Vanrija pseudolonga TaxID=143232 RepID=A0AAF0YCB1_9TREE|nr:hypothetical protein LOC62_05G007644 [Vanrija pseudolonga]